MFHFIFLVDEATKADAHTYTKRFGYDALIITSTDETVSLEEFVGTCPNLYILPWSAVEPRNERYARAHRDARLGPLLYEIADQWGGSLFFMNLTDPNFDFETVNFHHVVGNIMNRGLYLHPSSPSTPRIRPEEDLSESLLEKIYWDVYSPRMQGPFYESPSLGFHYDRTWVKKMLFELVHLSISPHIVEGGADFDFLLQFLHNKYCLDYVPSQ